MDLSTTKAIFFDFDGVIVESVDLKLKAFEQLFSAYGEEVLEKIRAHTLLHGGISRKEKIPFYFKEYIGQQLSPSECAEVCEQYSLLVRDKVVKSPLVEGVQEFLSLQSSKRTYAIITGTPQEEIDYIIERLPIQKHFADVCGSPEHKDTIIARLLSKYAVNPHEALMIGDSMTDYEAARTTEVPFLLRHTEESAANFAEIDVPRILNFFELLPQQESASAGIVRL